jgi:hypothetical protein
MIKSVKMNYPLLTAHERTVLCEYKRTYTRLLLEFLKAVQNGNTPVGYEALVIKCNNLEQQLPPSVAFSARKHIDLAWDPSLAEAYGIPATERRSA